MKKPYTMFVVLIVVLISILGLYHKKLATSLNYIQYGTTTSMANRGDIGGPRAVTEAEAEKLRLNQAREVTNFSSKILGLSFDYPAWWGQLTEKIDPPHEMRSYENWILSGYREPQEHTLFSFQTITPSTTPIRWEGAEIFSYSKKSLEELCKSHDFVNIKYLGDPKVNCAIKTNKNGVAYLKFTLSFYSDYVDRTYWAIDGILIKTKSEKFPLLVIYDQRQPDYVSPDNTDHITSLKNLEIIGSSFSYPLIPPTDAEI